MIELCVIAVAYRKSLYQSSPLLYMFVHPHCCDGPCMTGMHLSVSSLHCMY